jgi:hypothetical protein
MIVTVLMAITLIPILTVVSHNLKEKITDVEGQNLLKYMGILALALGALSVMLGVFLLFEFIEHQTLAEISFYTSELILISILSGIGAVYIFVFGLIFTKLRKKTF